MPQPLKCGLTSTVAQPLDSVWDQETRRANEVNYQTTTKSLHNCTPARYSRSSGPARFSTTRKNKQFENPLRKEPVARAPGGTFERGAGRHVRTERQMLLFTSTRSPKDKGKVEHWLTLSLGFKAHADMLSLCSILERCLHRGLDDINCLAARSDIHATCRFLLSIRSRCTLRIHHRNDHPDQIRA